jgi:hypothetical protein
MTATTYRPRRSSSVLRRGLDLLAGAVRLAASVCAVLLVVHILLTVFHANPGNALTQFFARASGGLALWFENLFTPDDPTLALVINHGLASLAYLIAAAIVARLLRAR